MNPKLYASDLGYYAVRFRSETGAPIAPDADGTLVMEFRDSADVLQFTATLVSTPALAIVDTDPEDIHVIVNGLDISTWSMGPVSVKTYAKHDGLDMIPSPFMATAFEIIGEEDYGYCLVSEVIEATGVEPAQFDLETAGELATLLGSWIQQASSIINSYCRTTWAIGTQPAGIRRAALMMVAEIVAVAIQRRKSPFVQVNNFTVKQVEDSLLTSEVTKLLDLYRSGVAAAATLFGMGVSAASRDEEAGE